MPSIAEIKQGLQDAAQQGMGQWTDPTSGRTYSAGATGNIVVGDGQQGGSFQSIDASGNPVGGSQQYAKPSGMIDMLGKVALGGTAAVLGGAAFGALGNGSTAGATMDGGSFDGIPAFDSSGGGDFVFNPGADSQAANVGIAADGGDPLAGYGMPGTAPDLGTAGGVDAGWAQALKSAGLNLPQSAISTLAKLFGGNGAGGGLNGILGNLVKGFASLNSAKVAENMGQELIKRADPFYSSRAGYADKLKQLEASHDVSQVPGYQAGLDAVQRAGAAQGFTGSGNMAVNLMQYGGDLYNKEATRLAHLAGADVQPGAGYASAAGLVGQGLASQGYGLDQFGNAAGAVGNGGLDALISQLGQGGGGGGGSSLGGGGGGGGGQVYGGDTPNPPPALA